jgi:hypothetical protein
MAYTQEAQFSFTVQDDLGTKANMTLYYLLDPTKTIADLVTDWQAEATLAVAILGGKLIHGTARIVLTPSADQSSKPISSSRVEQTAVFDETNASNPRIYGIAVPSIADSKITGGVINLADTDVAAFVTSLSAASGTSTSEPTSNQFLVLNGLRDAFLSFRKRRKQLERSSYEL